MSLRSIVLGFTFGLLLSVITYFNDHVLRQNYLVGNLMPFYIFGTVLLAIFFVNPIFKRLRSSLALKPLEIAVITAIGLAACGWPGGSFMRLFIPVVTVPGNAYSSKTAWKDTHVLSYIPGCSSQMAEGFVKDWVGLAKGIVAGESQKGAAEQMWKAAPFEGKDLLRSVAEKGSISSDDKRRFVDALNGIIGTRELYVSSAFAGILLPAEAKKLIAKRDSAGFTDRQIERLNRLLLEATFPGTILPAPAGEGILLENGDPNAPALNNLWSGDKNLTLATVPWKAWQSTILFWVVLALLVGLISLFLVIIILPQWKRELLPFPIARLILDAIEPAEKGFLPKVAQSKLFWYGFGLVFLIHVINGLQAWFPDNIKILMTFDFSGLSQVFSPVFLQNAGCIATPRLVPTAIALAFFLNKDVSFSAGISPVVFGLFAMFMISNGLPVSRNAYDFSNFSMMHFGCYVGSAIMILYLGRRYYLEVLACGLGFGVRRESTPTAIWALRGLVLTVVGFIAVLAANGLEWWIGLLLITCIIVIFLVLTRINAETGLFLNKPEFMPVIAITTLLGVQAIGPVMFGILFLCSFILAGDVRECIMPFLSNSLYLATKRGKDHPAKGVIPSVLVMVVVSLITALGATLFFQYKYGYDYQDWWITLTSQSLIDMVSSKIGSLSAYNELSSSMAAQGLERLSMISPNWTILGWMIAGIVIVLSCSIMRTRFSWWPIHPVLFLVWGTWFPSDALAPSIIVGWMLKSAVMRFAGSKGYHTVKPFMIGAITGEMIAALLWSIFGAIYYFMTTQAPKTYQIFWN